VQKLRLVIPATQETEIWRIWFEASPGKKLVRLHLKNKLGMVMQLCDPSYPGGRGRRIKSEVNLPEKGLTVWLKWQSTCLASSRL
jgi:hypothetical protein